MFIIVVSMLHMEEIRRCQSLRERAKDLREQAARICAQSQAIIGRSVNHQKVAEVSRNGPDEHNAPSLTDRPDPLFKS
jgi:hypothetical protein